MASFQLLVPIILDLSREPGWYGVRIAADFDKPSSVDRLAAAVASAAFMLERS